MESNTKTQGIQVGIDVGDLVSHLVLDLYNKSIEVDTYKTPPRISSRRKVNIEQIPIQKLISLKKDYYFF